MSSTTYNPADRQVIDIGGSKLDFSFEKQLPLAFAHKADFPKEVAYTTAMDKWYDIADNSYQTSDEMSIIEATAKEVVSQLPSGTSIIDLGAANSKKFEPYVREFLAQGKECTYVALDISQSSLNSHLANAKKTFPGVKTVGLWGSFQDGDAFFHNIPGARLFLSLGSIFYNAPDGMCKDRCDEFHRHLSAADRLVVGQDGPSETESVKSHASYKTTQYDAFFTAYLEGVQGHAGIVADAKSAWSVESCMDKAMHFFNVTAEHDIVCTKFSNFLVKKGTTYMMFPSWKRGEVEIHEITNKQHLAVKTLGKAANSGMRQYLIQAE
ncbi:hypothetical protein FALBO_2799 [Fusarium albosuccineum]|uniref:Histidine-specific methyltransferase SAM-dependent domain-containing protein n=1 Tax=Fusarium albosuccineum TaxID=1237068 RepID=A0A8H4PGI2_9HYPO|nr:hypothetical protein FALBO_2799 [Fusarium albosuccineum]